MNSHADSVNMFALIEDILPNPGSNQQDRMGGNPKRIWSCGPRRSAHARDVAHGRSSGRLVGRCWINCHRVFFVVKEWLRRVFGSYILRVGIQLSILGFCLLSLSQGLSAQQFQPRVLSVEKEAALGAQLAAELRAHKKPVANQAVQEYVQGVGRRLSGPATSLFPWTFEVVTGLAGHSTTGHSTKEHSTEEPVALPGGYVFLPAQLLLDAHNEAELAGMMAHAMAHVIARDSTGAAEVPGMATIPLIFVGGWQGQSGVPIAYREIQREREAAADARASDILRLAGYQAQAGDLGVAGADFLEMQGKLLALVPGRRVGAVPSLFGGHQ